MFITNIPFFEYNYIICDLPYFLRFIRQINCEKDVIKVLENSNIQY